MLRLIFTLCVLALHTNVLAFSIVSPNGLETVAGNARNCIPTTGCLSVGRYQQVFNKTEFSALSEPALVTAIAFRRDDLQFGGGASAFSHTFSDIRIGLSTTSVNAGNLASAFNSNRGADFTSVHQGALTVSSASSGFGTAQPFDVIINFQTPFLYNPLLGNLLFEWQNFGGEAFSGGVLDAHTAADGASRSLSTAGDPNAALATSINSTALVARITFAAPVPEPGTLALAALGLCAGCGARRRTSAAA